MLKTMFAGLAALSVASLAVPGMMVPAAMAAVSHEAFAKLPPITEAYAKARILNADYTNATDFVRTAAGWTANAQESGKPVSLLVNDLGGVAKQ